MAGVRAVWHSGEFWAAPILVVAPLGMLCGSGRDCRTPGRRLTASCHGYIICGKSDEGQDTSSRVEVGNANLIIIRGQVNFIFQLLLEKVCFHHSPELAQSLAEFNFI